jgi:hypothetical protein
VSQYGSDLEQIARHLEGVREALLRIGGLVQVTVSGPKNETSPGERKRD